MTILSGILALLLVILFGVRFLNQRQEEKEAEEEEAKNVYVTEMDAERIQKLSYDNGSEVFTFEKKDDEWIYTEDEDFPLNQSYPEQITETFSKLKAQRELKDGDSPEEYGLDEPVYEITLTDSEGTETRLIFGNSTGDCYYLQNCSTENIYTVESSAVSDLQYSLDEMAQLDTYPSIGSGNLKKVIITEKDVKTVYDSENEDNTEDIAAIAGGLGAVSLTEAANYSVEDKELESYGLDQENRITVEADYTDNGEEEALMLYIGNEDGSGNWYVMINESKIVYQISDAVCDNILNVED